MKNNICINCGFGGFTPKGFCLNCGYLNRVSEFKTFIASGTFTANNCDHEGDVHIVKFWIFKQKILVCEKCRELKIIKK